MKGLYAKKRKEKAEADGLDGDSIDCQVCHNTAKSTMVALAMKGSTPTLTKKKLQIKTEKGSSLNTRSWMPTPLLQHFCQRASMKDTGPQTLRRLTNQC